VVLISIVCGFVSSCLGVASNCKCKTCCVDREGMLNQNERINSFSSGVVKFSREEKGEEG
jgi:hypothetical protein